MSEQIALGISGLLTPVIIQAVRALLGDVSAHDRVALIITLISSAAMAAAGLAISGEISGAGDLAEGTAMVMSLATIIYKSFQSQWDMVLSFKSKA